MSCPVQSGADGLTCCVERVSPGRRRSPRRGPRRSVRASKGGSHPRLLCATFPAPMLHGKTIVVVLPAYRAEATLERAYGEIPHDVVDRVLLVDDASDDATVDLARTLGIETFVHDRNLGYGANQKTCYVEALARGADIVVMLH